MIGPEEDDEAYYWYPEGKHEEFAALGGQGFHDDCGDR